MIRSIARRFMGTPEPVVKIGHPVLKLKAKMVSPDRIGDKYTVSVIHRMKQQLTKRMNPLIGIAAPQLGESLRIIGYKLDDKHCMEKLSIDSGIGSGSNGENKVPLTILINPQVRILDPRPPASWEQDYEFCESIPYYSALIPRADKIHVQALDEQGELVSFKTHGFLSRVIQHEMDHLDGISMIERMIPGSLRHDEHVV